MSENNNERRKITIPSRGVLTDIAQRIKLILRLMADSRVHPLLKVIPIGSLAYFLIPDLAPGPIDDMAVIWLATYLFVELCPPEVVQEHMENLKSEIPDKSSETQEPPKAESDVIDAEFWEGGEKQDQSRQS
jgi:hypothetical protein